MSGGHFNYACHKISHFAEALQHEIDVNDDKTLDDYNCPRGYNYKPETITRLNVILQIIESAGKLAREVEWLYSGDHGEDTFNSLCDKILGGVK